MQSAREWWNGTWYRINVRLCFLLLYCCGGGGGCHDGGWDSLCVFLSVGRWNRGRERAKQYRGAEKAATQHDCLAGVLSMVDRAYVGSRFLVLVWLSEAYLILSLFVRPQVHPLRLDELLPSVCRDVRIGPRFRLGCCLLSLPWPWTRPILRAGHSLRSDLINHVNSNGLVQRVLLSQGIYVYVRCSQRQWHAHLQCYRSVCQRWLWLVK